MKTKSVLIWIGFIIIIGLIIWGLIVAEQKSKENDRNILLPDQIVSADHIWGSETAPKTIVKYSDLQCPACRGFSSFKKKLINEKDTL